MMVTNPKNRRYTLDQWQALEEDTGIRHEYEDGHVYALAGGSTKHSFVSQLVGHRLMEHLLGSPYRVYSSDATIRISETCHLYPDVVVSCDVSDYDSNEICSPHLIVEVLSKSTERRDRNTKFALYKTLPAFKEYVLVSTKECKVEVFRKAEGWKAQVYGPGEEIELQSLDIPLPIEDIYRYV